MQLQDIGLIKKLAMAFIFVGLVLLIGHELELYLPDLEVLIQKLGAFAPLGFIMLFVVLTPLFISVDALCFAAGLLFPIGAGRFISSSQPIWHRHLFFFWAAIYCVTESLRILPNTSIFPNSTRSSRAMNLS